MKSNDVCTKHPIEKWLAPGTDSKGFWIGPGDVPKNSDSGLLRIFHYSLLKKPRQERKVIVLNENERTFSIGFNRDCCGEPVVDLLVLLPVSEAKNGTSVSEVTKRPEALIRKSIVVAHFFCLCEGDSS